MASNKYLPPGLHKPPGWASSVCLRSAEARSGRVKAQNMCNRPAHNLAASAVTVRRLNLEATALFRRSLEPMLFFLSRERSQGRKSSRDGRSQGYPLLVDRRPTGGRRLYHTNKAPDITENSKTSITANSAPVPRNWEYSMYPNNRTPPN